MQLNWLVLIQKCIKLDSAEFTPHSLVIAKDSVFEIYKVNKSEATVYKYNFYPTQAQLEIYFLRHRGQKSDIHQKFVPEI